MTAPLGDMRAIVQKLFPWLKGIRVVTGGGLSFRTAGGLLHLQGEPGDPAAARVGDLVVRLVRDSVSGLVYYSTSTESPYSWAPLASVVGAPTISDAGTAIRIVEGSGKVTCG